MKRIYYFTVFFFLIFVLLAHPESARAYLKFFDSFSNGLGNWTVLNNTSGNTVTTEFDNTDPQHGYLLKIHYSGNGYVKLEKQLSAPIQGTAEIDFYDYGNGHNDGTLFSIVEGENYIGLGLNTNQFGQTYYYRSNNQIVDSGIPRTFGYHKFRLITSSSGAWGEIDGVSLKNKAINPSVTQIENITIEELDWVHDTRNTWYDNAKVEDINPWQLPHQIISDQNGLILPWFSSSLGSSYDHIIGLLWNYWNDVPVTNGTKNYLQYRTADISAGADGDQLTEALSSWRLLYQYSGNPGVLNNMISIADFYLADGLSGSTAQWPNIPFSSNSDGLSGDIYSPPSHPVGPGYYYGDLIRGAGFTRPTIAGDLGSELIPLYEMTGNMKYLTAAINIADTLAGKEQPGDAESSPLPFRVNVNTGQITDSYTSDWTGTLTLFDELIKLNKGNTSVYKTVGNTISEWLKKYPMKTNKWGPTFSDVSGWSNTETNADTLAWYILENPSWDQNWQQDARSILNWTETAFGNSTWNGVNWSQYGVLPINEQTEYPMPGNSHTARHGSVEIIYAGKTGDTSKKSGAVRELSWATYLVDSGGANHYPENKIWYEDGYGDFIRHYLRAMESAPELAAPDQNHLLGTTSFIKSISYGQNLISYKTFDTKSQEVLRINFVPVQVSAGGINLSRLTDISNLNNQQGYTYNAPGDVNGVLRIMHDRSGDIVINGTIPSLPGDLNHDSVINIQDYNQLVADFGKTGSPGWIASDINSDGKVDIFDYNILVGNFGKTQ